MTVKPELSQLLVDMGVSKPEADVYVQLLLLAADGPATGYQLAKALKKDPTSVYKALEALVRLGAVEVDPDKTKRYRPVPAKAFTRQLVNDLKRKRRLAVETLSGLGAATRDQRVYSLRGREQVFDRCRELLQHCRQVTLLDLTPEIVAELESEIAAVARRGAAVVLRLYRPATILGVLTVEEPEGELLLELMPGPKLQCVVDCSRQLNAFLSPRPGSRSVPQAIFSASPFLAYQAHLGLADEIVQTELRRLLAAGVTAAEMEGRHRELARLIHGRVDWEELWREMGIPAGADAGEPAVSERAASVLMADHTETSDGMTGDRGDLLDSSWQVTDRLVRRPSRRSRRYWQPRLGKLPPASEPAKFSEPKSGFDEPEGRLTDPEDLADVADVRMPEPGYQDSGAPGDTSSGGPDTIITEILARKRKYLGKRGPR